LRTRQRLKAAYEAFGADGDVAQLLSAARANQAGEGEPEPAASAGGGARLKAEELHLVCWEYVVP
jgi:hypothetical protein